MDLDARLVDATRKAVGAAKAIDHAKLPEWQEDAEVFTLCRYLAAVDDHSDADALRPYLDLFWGAVRRPDDPDEAWEQFCFIRDKGRARIPPGVNLVDIAARRARDTQDPPWAQAYRPSVRHLVRICIELDRMRLPGGFGLSQIDAARNIGCTQPSAGNKIHQLVRDRVIIVTRKASQGRKRATRYRVIKPYPD